MSARMPVVFVSHGAPDALIKAPDTVACWSAIRQQVPPPSAILVVSAHWEAARPTLSLSAAPTTVHDFAGFDPRLYQLRYPAPGAPALAGRVLAQLAKAGITADTDPERGLDHGAWVPLLAMYPEADIPVTQLSLIHGGSVATHYALGQALAPLRDEGVLIVASGAITHNFAWLDFHASAGQPPLAVAQQFCDWLGERILAGDAAAVLGYRDAPYGADAHPSEEHFHPLAVALGASGGDRAARFRPEFTYRGLSMDAYLWPSADAAPT
ncbi:dioxygenase [Rhodocyclus gracilis]|nr:class III extradiol ring-cleavage dioxygenase [Rhodocyclus gracilis]